MRYAACAQSESDLGLRRGQRAVGRLEQQFRLLRNQAMDLLHFPQRGLGLGQGVVGQPGRQQHVTPFAAQRYGRYVQPPIAQGRRSAQYRIWYNHGISHGIGLNVHDPTAGELQPGMAVTVEPGLYFRPDALDNLEKTPENEKFIAAVRPVFERYKNIGVRIEDDVLITKGEPEVLSAAIPSKLEEVEATIASLRRALPANPLP